MEQKHIIFVILVLLTLGWIALSYSNIDFGANEEKILERESYRSSLDQTGKRQGSAIGSGGPIFWSGSRSGRAAPIPTPRLTLD